MKKYNEELNKQIELNKILKNKNIKVKKEDKYLLNEKESKKELQEIKINKINDEENNKDINDINDNNINNLNKDEMISKMVDKIMKQKKEEKIDNILNGIRSKYYLEKKEYFMPEIKYDTKKVDEIMAKEMRKYQDI